MKREVCHLALFIRALTPYRYYRGRLPIHQWSWWSLPWCIRKKSIHRVFRFVSYYFLLFISFEDFSTVTPSEANGIFNEFSQMYVPPSKVKAAPVIVWIFFCFFFFFFFLDFVLEWTALHIRGTVLRRYKTDRIWKKSFSILLVIMRVQSLLIWH